MRGAILFNGNAETEASLVDAATSRANRWCFARSFCTSAWRVATVFRASRYRRAGW